MPHDTAKYDASIMINDHCQQSGMAMGRMGVAAGPLTGGINNCAACNECAQTPPTFFAMKIYMRKNEEKRRKKCAEKEIILYTL